MQSPLPLAMTSKVEDRQPETIHDHELAVACPLFLQPLHASALFQPKFPTTVWFLSSDLALLSEIFFKPQSSPI